METPTPLLQSPQEPAHKGHDVAELAGLGTLAAPLALGLAHHHGGMPLPSMLQHLADNGNQAWVHGAELAGLGILAIPSAIDLMQGPKPLYPPIESGS